MEGGALLTDEFANFGKDYVLFCHITTRIATDKHQELLSQKGGQGFPYIVFMDPSGEVVAEHEEDRTAELFGKTGQKAKAFVDLKQRAEKGDASAKADLVISQLDMGQLKAADAEAKWRALAKPAADQQARYEVALSGAVVMEVVGTIRDENSQAAAAKKLYEMQKAGKPAPTSERAMASYWGLVLEHAESLKDAATFEAALKALKAKFGANPRAEKYFKDKGAKLQELRAGGEKK